MKKLVWEQVLIEKYNYCAEKYSFYPTALEFDEGYITQEDASLLTMAVSTSSATGHSYSQSQHKLGASYQKIEQLRHAQWRDIGFNEDDLIHQKAIKKLIANICMFFGVYLGNKARQHELPCAI